jgi:Type II CAAX prenyl endopeptidase Rce1-like
MWALERPAGSRQPPVLADTPLALVAGLGSAWLACASLERAGWLPDAALSAVGFTAAHGGLLAVALAWGAANAGLRLPPEHLALVIALVAAGATAASLHEWGTLAFLATPAWLAVLGARGLLTGLGIGPPVAIRPMLAGGAIGAVLGVHLMFSAAQTLGYAPRGAAWPAILARWAYDLGANVISAECFFRGALFNRLQRRWSFAPAAAVATACALVRYVSDPILPGQTEVVVGALFYVTILGVANCWLLWWSGSLLPGLVASALFFFAYRVLALG